MEELIPYHPLLSLLKASWQGAVLILLVMVTQWAFRRQLSPRWRYGLWLLVVIRLVLPWTLPSPVSVFNFLKYSRASYSLAGAQASPNVASSTVSQPAAAVAAAVSRRTISEDKSAPIHFGGYFGNGSLSPWLGTWFAGALGLTIYLLVSHYRFSRRVSARRPLIDAPLMNLLEDCKQQMGVRAPVTLVESGEVGSPALFGFVRPRLLLPAGLARSFSPEELRYVFLHELGHIKRHDILAGWLMTALQILHWFNPLVWLAF